MLDWPPKPLQHFFKTEPFQYQKCAVEQAPNDETPTGAVPKASQEKNDEQVDISAAHRHPVAAKWYVEVITEPSGQRDMPAPPKLLDTAGIIHIGTGETSDLAWEPRVVEKNGIKIAFIGAS